jgi:hypothetical protein
MFYIINTERSSERALVAAILCQAVSDAMSKDPICKPEQAFLFLNKNNKLFCDYCILIDLEPEWAERKIKEQMKKIKRLRIRDK